MLPGEVAAMLLDVRREFRALLRRQNGQGLRNRAEGTLLQLVDGCLLRCDRGARSLDVPRIGDENLSGIHESGMQRRADLPVVPERRLMNPVKRLSLFGRQVELFHELRHLSEPGVVPEVAPEGFRSMPSRHQEGRSGETEGKRR